MLKSSLTRASLCIALAVGAFTLPSMAKSKWPGDVPSPGSALAAKAIGQECRMLTASEIGELDAYLAKAGSEITRRDSGFDFHGFETDLYARYVADYRKSGACTADAAELAKDAVANARRAMQTGKLFAD